MATKAETISHIKSNYKVQEDDGTLFLVFNAGESRSQGVFVFVDDFKMEIKSAFATTESISAEQAFEATEAVNTAFGIGRDGSFYVVKHVVPIADLDPSEIIAGIELPMSVADDLEKELGLGDSF